MVTYQIILAIIIFIIIRNKRNKNLAEEFSGVSFYGRDDNDEEYEEEDQLNENIKHLDEKRTVKVEFMDDTEAMEFKKEMEERYGVNRASRYALPKGTGKHGTVFVESKLFNKILGETLKEGSNYGHGRNDVYHEPEHEYQGSTLEELIADVKSIGNA